jgi:hypothetical protein
MEREDPVTFQLGPVFAFSNVGNRLSSALGSTRKDMKKTTKVTKALTPAKKSTKVVRKAPPVPAAKVKPSAVVTTISAHIDIGFGNALCVRGEGAGLSWDKGTRMECIADDRWSLALGESSRPIIFKFLINDLTWSTGHDFSVASGSSVALKPLF